MSFELFTKEEFDKQIKNIISDLKLDDPTPNQQGKEYVVDVPVNSGKLALRIFSSIDVRTNESRSKGADAIRVAFIDPEHNKPIGKATRTHRTTGWEKRLKRKIRDLLDNKPKLIRCPKCHNLLAKRKGEYGTFYGCTSYPKCKFTLSMKQLKEILAKKKKKKQKRKKEGKLKPEEASKEFRKCLYASHKLDPGEVTVHEADPNNWAPNDSVDFYNIKYPTYNPCQSSVLPFIQEDSNVVLAASTSSGKTLCAALLIGKALQDNRKGLFASPLKAVTLQKYREWTDPEHPFGQYKVSIVTGDFRLTKKRKKELRNADIILLTSEMIDSKTRLFYSEMNYWLRDSGILVYDESHLITKQSRGDAVECGLMRFSMLNPEARIVFLSATMPNVEELGDWLSHLNGKDTRVIRCNWRPVDLDMHFKIYPDDPSWGSYHQNEAKKRAGALEIIKENPDDKYIVFVHSKAAGRATTRLLDEHGFRVQFHNADLTKDKKEQIEKDLESNKIQIIVATPTICWGINLSARRVIVLGVHRGISVIDDLGIEINQMAGRAGRVGLQDKGDAYVLIPQSDSQKLIEEIVNVKPIDSKLVNPDLLAFHITAEIAQGAISRKEDVSLWYQRSFAYEQNPEPQALETTIENLLKRGIIKEDKEFIKPTILGKAASWLYYNPFDVADWANNFQRVFQCDKAEDDHCIAWALARTHTEKNREYIAKQLQPKADDITNNVGYKLSSSVSDGSLFLGNAAHAAALYHAILTNDTSIEGVRGEMISYQFDSERVCAALKILNKYVIKQAPENYWDALAMRIRWGASWQEVELMKGQGIGIGRARRLIENDITSIQDFFRNPRDAVAAIGKKVYQKAAKSFRKIGYGK